MLDQNKIVIGMGIAIVIGLFLMISATANPTGKITEKTFLSPNGSLSLSPIVNGKQDVFLKATEYGTYVPNYLIVKKGIPVRIHFSADDGAACGREVIFPEYKVRKLAPSGGETLIEFTPLNVGKFPFHCSMKMFNGTIEVVE